MYPNILHSFSDMGRLGSYLLLGAILHGVVFGNGCRFPAFLTPHGDTDSVWLYHIRNQGAFGADHHILEVFFTNDLMAVGVSAGFRVWPVEKSYVRTCVNQTGDKYTVSHTEVGSNETYYLCMQFYHQSEATVLLRHAPMTIDRAEVSCSHLSTDNWPMVLRRYPSRGQNIPTDLIGGYNIEPSGGERAEWLQSCNTSNVPPVDIDFGCLPHDAVTIDFHTADCIPPGLLVEVVEPMVAIASWIQYNYIFIILQSRNHLIFWCVRIPRKGAKAAKVEMEIFLDLACDPTDDFREGANRMAFVLTRSHLSDTPDVNDMTCLFDENFQGKWQLLDGSGHIDINGSHISIPSYPQYTCLGTTDSVTSPGITRVPLYSIMHDGCYPKFTCLELSTRSPSVARYRLGKISALSQDRNTVVDPQREFCNENQLFAGEVDLQTNRYIPIRFSHMVRPAPRNNDLQHVPCDLLTGHPLFNFYTVTNDEPCDGNLMVSCHSESTLVVGSSSCPMWTPHSGHRCLAVFPETRGGHVIITESTSEPRDLSCWIFKKNYLDMFFLPSGDCGEHTALEYEQSGKLKGEGSIFVFSIQEVNRTCPLPTADELTTQPEGPWPETPAGDIVVSYTIGRACHIAAPFHSTLVLLAYLCILNFFS